MILFVFYVFVKCHLRVHTSPNVVLSSFQTLNVAPQRVDRGNKHYPVRTCTAINYPLLPLNVKESRVQLA